jgi:hypothetical protein
MESYALALSRLWFFAGVVTYDRAYKINADMGRIKHYHSRPSSLRQLRAGQVLQVEFSSRW